MVSCGIEKSIYKSILVCIFLLGCFSSCKDYEGEKKLQEKETRLLQKEQELSLKEQSLQWRESELAKKEHLLDSASHKISDDSMSALRTSITGLWTVKMNCTETTCPSSAVGDVKAEQWAISIENNVIISKSMSNNNTSRIYTGKYAGNVLELTAVQDSTEAGRSTKMNVRLQLTKDNEMEGQRQIIRGEDCQIIYEMQLKKQS